jgi:hypothetical protein
MSLSTQECFAILDDVNSSVTKIKKVLQTNEKYIKFLKNPSLQVIEYCISICKDLSCLKYLDVTDPNIHKLVLKHKPEGIKYLKNLTHSIIKEFINKNPNNVYWVSGYSHYDEYKKLAVTKQPSAIVLIKNPSIELQELVININPENINWIKKPHESIVTKAIKKNTKCLRFIKKLNTKQKLLALNLNPESIIYIKNPTEAMQKIVMTYMLEKKKDHLIFHLSERNLKKYRALTVFS